MALQCRRTRRAQAWPMAAGGGPPGGGDWAPEPEWVGAVRAGELGRRPAEKVLNTVEVSGRGPRTPHPHREARAARG